MTRKFERGGIASFVIIGLLLLGLLAGGIYFVRNKMNPGTGTTGGEVASQSASSDTKTSSSDQNQDLKDALAAQSSEEKKAEEQRKAQQSETTSTSATAGTTNTTTSNAVSTASGGSTTSSSLPATGPEEAIVPLLGAVLLTGVGIAFVRSRALL